MTNDLISRKKALEIIKANHYPLRAEHNTVDYGMFTVGIEQAINDAPAVDAVEVVRCCDCIHHRVPVKDECGAIQFLYCYHPLQEEGELMLRVDFTDYCSYGERRESEVSE